MGAEHRDTKILRKRFVDACKKRGFVLAVRTLIRVGDGVEPCPNCYDDLYGNASSTSCPVCFGGGFLGGYRPTKIVWGEVTFGSDSKEEEHIGVFDKSTGAFSADHTVLINQGDLVRDIYSYRKDGNKIVPEEFGTLCIVKDNVAHETMKGKLRGHNRGESHRDADVFIWQHGDLVIAGEEDHRQSVEF